MEMMGNNILSILNLRPLKYCAVRGRGRSWRSILGIIFLCAAAGCAHYPVNQPLNQADPRRVIGQGISSILKTTISFW